MKENWIGEACKTKEEEMKGRIYRAPERKPHAKRHI
jgi:hypothetical protein